MQNSIFFRFLKLTSGEETPLRCCTCQTPQNRPACRAILQSGRTQLVELYRSTRSASKDFLVEILPDLFRAERAYAV
jgi:hypothetical protein